MHELVAALAAWVSSVVQTGGYPGVGFLTLLENLIPPIPSELILPAAGYLVNQGQLEFGWVVVASTLGSLAGALILYWLGYALGEARLRRFVRSYGRWLALDESDLEQAQEWFRRHGGMAVLIGRLIPAARSIISIPAGLNRMPLVPFVVYTTLGSGLWNAALVGAGWLLGEHVDRIKPLLGVLGWATLLALAVMIVRFVRRRRGGQRPESPEQLGPSRSPSS